MGEFLTAQEVVGGPGGEACVRGPRLPPPELPQVMAARSFWVLGDGRWSNASDDKDKALKREVRGGSVESEFIGEHFARSCCDPCEEEGLTLMNGARALEGRVNGC